MSLIRIELNACKSMIETFFSKKLLEANDLVVAGGFATAILFWELNGAKILEDEEKAILKKEKEEEVLRNKLAIAGGLTNVTTYDTYIPTIMKQSLAKRLKMYFRDIDVFCVGESAFSEVFNRKLKLYEIPDNSFMSKLSPPEADGLIDCLKSLFNTQKNNIDFKFVSQMSLSLNVKKFFMNSWDSEADCDQKIQFIRPDFKLFDSIEDLLNDFDLSICRAAIHNGAIYATQECVDLLSGNSKTLDVVLSKGSAYNRIVTMNRINKYAARYQRHFKNMHIADEIRRQICDEIVNYALEWENPPPPELLNLTINSFSLIHKQTKSDDEELSYAKIDDGTFRSNDKINRYVLKNLFRELYIFELFQKDFFSTDDLLLLLLSENSFANEFAQSSIQSRNAGTPALGAKYGI